MAVRPNAESTIIVMPNTVFFIILYIFVINFATTASNYPYFKIIDARVSPIAIYDRLSISEV